jgi:hypothetical protein
MNYPFKEFAKVGILRQTGKAKCKKMAKIAVFLPKNSPGTPNCTVKLM